MQLRTAPIIGALVAIGLSLVPACLNAGSPVIPSSQIGAKAGANYQGDGLAVSPSMQGAHLRCIFQRLEGEATREGLWLTSTHTEAVKDGFRVVAVAVGRQAGRSERLSNTGTVAIDARTVLFTRPGMVEEYSVSMDGVQQDFVLPERPAGQGRLAVWLAVSGAHIEPAAFGARLALDNSGRKIAYSRLRVTDTTGRELSARIEVAALNSEVLNQRCEMAVVVNDTDAVYPVRIDPTFSDANWTSFGGVPGADGIVTAAAVDTAGNLYIGGAFVAVGHIVANGVAKWNGSSWSALGSGMDNEVDALAVSGNEVYAAGGFTTAGGIAATNIAKWNGSSWSALGSGLTAPAAYPFYGGRVSALAVLGSNVYAGGSFTTAGGIAATNIARWDGSDWSDVGGLSAAYTIFHPYPGVHALAVSGSDLYAGGDFDTAGGIAASSIAKWDGNGWSALGSGMGTYGFVYALAVSGSNLYAGGSFTTAGGNAANNIAKWDGSTWSALGSGAGEVRSLANLGGDLYAGGDFTTAGGIAATNIAKWDGSTWSALGSGVSGGLGQYSGGVLAMAASGSSLYAGGPFSIAGGNPAFGVAKWKRGIWSGFGSGMDGEVEALAVSGGDLYMGGGFTKVFSTAGGTAANYIAKWNGNSWSALGSGMDDRVYALAVSGSNVYAGGDFTNAGGVAANFVAKWNGNSWSALGSGMNSTVAALAVSGSNLYAGGYFTRAGGSTVNYIAKWNGSSWSHMGTGLAGSPGGVLPNVFALAVSGDNLYAGGGFKTAGGIPAANIAKWDGSTWSALGSGMDNIVYALAVSGSDLYAGGAFFSAGGIPVAYVARWDGSSWLALDAGIGIYSSVYALAVSGTDVYAGGAFVTLTPTANGAPGTTLAKWDGSSWSVLGSGVSGGGGNPSVYALAASDSDLYVGGGFTTVGSKVSQYIVRASLLPIPPVLSVRPSSTLQGSISISWPSADTDGFSLEQTSTLNSPASWAPDTAPITDDGITRSVILPATNDAQFFRLRKP
jgi:hypothetical protein